MFTARRIRGCSNIDSRPDSGGLQGGSRKSGGQVVREGARVALPRNGIAMTTALLAVACGGAVGAVARYLVYLGTAQILGMGFPFATLLVNIIGSFLMGLLIELSVLAWTPTQEVRLFLATGVLGSFTTFSTFSLDFAALYERGKFLLCALYLGASVMLSIGAFFAAVLLLRHLLEARA